jgi:large subunit ribosomal protein L14
MVAKIMVQIGSILIVVDNTSVSQVKVIGVQNGGQGRQIAYTSDIVVGAIVAVNRLGKFKKGEIVKGVVVTTKRRSSNKAGSTKRFNQNGFVIINKDKEPVGTRIRGCLPAEIRQFGWGKLLPLCKEVQQ